MARPRLKKAEDLRAAELRRLKKVFKGKESVLADLERRLGRLRSEVKGQNAERGGSDA